MSKSTYPLKLPTSVKKAAAELAAADAAASIIAQNGPGPMLVISTTLMPERGPAIACLPFAICSDFEPEVSIL